jgi:hypothetical protein
VKGGDRQKPDNDVLALFHNQVGGTVKKIIVALLVAASFAMSGVTVEATDAQASDVQTVGNPAPSFDFNPAPFSSDWDAEGNRVVTITGADPNAVQTVQWHYYNNPDSPPGTNGTVNGQFAKADGTATIVIASRHFLGDRSRYGFIAWQTRSNELEQDLEVSGFDKGRYDIVGEGGSTTSYCGYNEVMNGKIIYVYFPGYTGYFGWGWYKCVWGDGSYSAAQVQCSWCYDYTHVLYDSGGYGEPFFGPAWLRIG